MSKCSFNTSGLDSLIKDLDQDLKVKVGVLTSTANRADSSENNAEVGVIHEFGVIGDDRFPERSFLRMPLYGYLGKAISKMSINPFTLNVKTFLASVGGEAVKIIQNAFASHGFGEWEISQRAMLDGGLTLVDTGQLEESITYEVVK